MSQLAHRSLHLARLRQRLQIIQDLATDLESFQVRNDDWKLQWQELELFWGLKLKYENMNVATYANLFISSVTRTWNYQLPEAFALSGVTRVDGFQLIVKWICEFWNLKKMIKIGSWIADTIFHTKCPYQPAEPPGELRSGFPRADPGGKSPLFFVMQHLYVLSVYKLWVFRSHPKWAVLDAKKGC